MQASFNAARSLTDMKRPLAIVGQTAAMRRISQEIAAAANSDVPVLISGESGVGRQLMAHTIHDRSARHAGPILTVHCAGLSDPRLESELFGHSTAGDGNTPDETATRGRLEAANHGTLVLQDVAYLSARLQGRVLRFMETKDVQPVGSVRLTPSDVRIIAMTQRQLINAVTTRAFREDLLYRLNVIHIEVPPLRERREDVPVLTRYFLSVHAARLGRPLIDVSDEAMACLTEYSWPGNVRELKEVVEELALTHTSAIAGIDALPDEIVRGSWHPAGPWHRVDAVPDRGLGAREARRAGI